MKWTKLRVPFALLLLPVAGYQVGKNLGFREGIEVKYGGPGSYQTAVVEWQDFGQRKVVLYLNSGADGYAFWFQLDPQYRHYSYCAKVFTCDNTSHEDIKRAMDTARDWCKNEWDGGDTRIVRGSMKPRGDEDALEADRGTVLQGTSEYVELISGREDISRLRKDCAELTLERDALRRRLEVTR